MLQAEFGQEPRSARDPETAIVLGAARWASQGESRSGGPLASEPGLLPLRWSIPDGSGKMTDWLVAVGEAYEENTALARVRLPDGTLWSLKAAVASVLRGQHAHPGDDVESGYWLATANGPGKNGPGKGVKRTLKTDGQSVSVLSRAGFVYLLTNSECHILDPSSGNLRMLCSTRKILQRLPSPGYYDQFLDLRVGNDSLRILVGTDRASARWVEVNKQTGAFLREVPK